jgi:hypothetical protein
MSTDIQHADPQLRRRTLAVLGASVVAAIAVMTWFHGWLHHSTAEMQREVFVLEIHRMVGISCTLLALGVLVLAGYAARVSRRIVESQRWPLHEARVVLDTRVRSGDEALALASTLRLVALVLIVVAFAIGIFGWRLVAA